MADAEAEQFLGAHAIDPHATELIAETAVVFRAEPTSAELAPTIHAYLTLADAWNEAGHMLKDSPIRFLPKRWV